MLSGLQLGAECGYYDQVLLDSEEIRLGSHRQVRIARHNLRRALRVLERTGDNRRKGFFACNEVLAKPVHLHFTQPRQSRILRYAIPAAARARMCASQAG
jgi:hypothetical protein